MLRYYLGPDGSLIRHNTTTKESDWWHHDDRPQETGWQRFSRLDNGLDFNDCIPVYPGYAELIMERGYPENHEEKALSNMDKAKKLSAELESTLKNLSPPDMMAYGLWLGSNYPVPPENHD